MHLSYLRWVNNNKLKEADEKQKFIKQNENVKYTKKKDRHDKAQNIRCSQNDILPIYNSLNFVIFKCSHCIIWPTQQPCNVYGAILQENPRLGEKHYHCFRWEYQGLKDSD